MCYKEPGVRSIRFLYSYFFYSQVISRFSLYIGLHAYSVPLFICYHVWMLICNIAVILIYHSDYIGYSIF